MIPLLDTARRHPDGAALMYGATDARVSHAPGTARGYAKTNNQDAGGSPNVSGGAQTLSWRELADAARRMAGALRLSGVRPGDVVATQLGATREHVVLLHAIWLCGAACAPLNLRLTPAERDAQITHLQPVAVVSDEADTGGDTSATTDLSAAGTASRAGTASAAGASRHLSPRALQERARNMDPTATELRAPGDDDICSILFTSGTAGSPKAVPHTWANHRASAAASAANLGGAPADVWQCVIPLYHIGGLAILLRSLFSGMAVRLHARFDAGEMLDAIRCDGVTITSLVPTMLHRLMEHDAEFRASAVPSLRAILLGGSAAHRGLWEEALRRGLPMLGTYGLTESCSQVATGSPDAVAEDAYTAGRPLEGLEIEIRDARDRPLPTGEEGEILLRGPMLARGYLQANRKMTREDAREHTVELEKKSATEPDIHAEPTESGAAVDTMHPVFEDGWFRTGDIGRFDARGCLVVAGRREDLIISGGENIAPQEIEDVLLRHDAVEEAAVVGLPDNEWGERVAAALVLRRPVQIDAIAAFCRSTLAGYKLPRSWHVLQSLPRTASGKMLRAELRAILLGREDNQQ